MDWKINLWARLKDGDHTLGMLKNQLRLTGSAHTMYDGGETYSSLFAVDIEWDAGQLNGAAIRARLSGVYAVRTTQTKKVRHAGKPIEDERAASGATTFGVLPDPMYIVIADS